MLRTALAVPLLAALAVGLGGCATSSTQRYFTKAHRATATTTDASLEVRFVRQSVRELVVLARLTNRGSTGLSVAPNGVVPSWSLTIDGRTLPLTEHDRTYWSAWSGTITRDRSPLKVTRDLAPGEVIDVEVRWRFEPALADAHAPWVLTVANLSRTNGPVAPLAVAFPAPDAGWVDDEPTNPCNAMRSGQRGWTNVRPWNAPQVDDSAD